MHRYELDYKSIKIRNLLKMYAHKMDVHPSISTGQYFNLDIRSEKLGLKTGLHVEFRNYCSVYIHEKGYLNIGDYVFFNNYCAISALGNIQIGSNTLFGEGVKLYDHNHTHQFDKDQLRVNRDDFSIGTIKIGNNCWIGSNVTILKDVEIGDNVIIGANCLIHKSIPANSIVKHQENLIIETSRFGKQPEN